MDLFVFNLEDIFLTCEEKIKWIALNLVVYLCKYNTPSLSTF